MTCEGGFDENCPYFKDANFGKNGVWQGTFLHEKAASESASFLLRRKLIRSGVESLKWLYPIITCGTKAPAAKGRVRKGKYHPKT